MQNTQIKTEAQTAMQQSAKSLLTEAVASLTWAANRADSIENLSEIEFDDIASISRLVHNALSNLRQIQQIQN
ncbi:MAG: hypothetical protein M3209_00055 [Acidobacteriota bacterium]|nr:hypothetical protein [Acidobacteriota bacterium]